MNSIKSSERITDIVGLRNVALSLLKEVMDGVAEPEKVKGFCSVANTVIGTLKVEIDFLKAKGAGNAEIDFIHPQQKLLNNG